MYDSHIHSNNSHDSKQTLDEICTAAIALGLKGISICDHADVCYSKELDTPFHIKNCIEDVKAARQKYGDNLKILQGVEMAEYITDTEEGEKLLNLCNYDVILGSVHTVCFDEFKNSYSRIDFGSISEERIYIFIKEYFNKMLEMTLKTDFDVLSHINCPMRYINGKYNRNLNIMKFKDEISDLLQLIIKKEIALEINTSGFTPEMDGLMPNMEIISLYKDLGGKLLTLGSDAHVSSNIGKGFKETKEMLKTFGFNNYVYFESRKPHETEL